ncbi:MAG: polyprenyl synthetase family protein [Pseudomonadales bacterium]
MTRMTERFTHYLASNQQRANDALSANLQALTQYPSTQPRLVSALRYCVLGGGKRVRPVLAYAAFEAAGGSAESLAVDQVACAVEYIHCYSLIHDDLPAMDDDDLRRGQPSCHRAYDEATAILTGDALQAMAFEQLAEPSELSATQRCELLRILARATGPQGMVGGQMLDLLAVDRKLTNIDLEALHRAKTGALICAALEMGAVCAAASDSQRQALVDYGNSIGLAFQVVDDILDVDAETSLLGKPQGADMRLNKPTYPALLGMEKARQYAKELEQQACATVAMFAEQGWALQALAGYVVNRTH